MCKRAQCDQCHKVTYTGCGKHLEQVFRGVAEPDRCTCREVVAIQLAQVVAIAPIAYA